MSRDRKKFSTMENARVSKTKEGMPWCKGGFEPFSEGGKRGGHTNLLRKSIPNSGSIEGKIMTKLFYRFMD